VQPNFITVPVLGAKVNNSLQLYSHAPYTHLWHGAYKQGKTIIRAANITRQAHRLQVFTLNAPENSTP
jgi:hypothetical protein